MSPQRYPILRATRDLRATDPRDKVFGLLGLACGHELTKWLTGITSYIPTADYTLSKKQAYTLAAKACIYGEGAGAKLDFLHEAGYLHRSPRLVKRLNLTEKGIHLLSLTQSAGQLEYLTGV
jgi:hypothetical protein